MTRVLWFVNVPPRSVRTRLGISASASGGWIDQLAEAVVDEEDLELSIACITPQAMDPFDEGGVHYYGLTRTAPRLQAAAAGWLGRPLGVNDLVAQAQAVCDAVAPSLIHIHGTERSWGLLAGIREEPVLVTIQGVMSAVADGFLLGREKAPEGWTSARATVGGTNPRQSQRVVRGLADLEARILAACHFVSGRTQWDMDAAARLAPSAQYFHIDELVHPRFLHGRWNPDTERNECVIYTTASAAPYKGVEVLVDALARLRSEGTACTLRVGGVTEESLLGRASMALGSDVGVAQAMQFLGRLTGDQVLDELVDCDVYACASHVENSPNSLCEAMAVGCPIVSTDVGGIPSLLADGSEGIHVSRGDSKGIAAAVRDLISDSHLARTLGDSARERATLRHDRVKVCGQLLDAYRTMLGS